MSAYAGADAVGTDDRCTGIRSHSRQFVAAGHTEFFGQLNGVNVNVGVVGHDLSVKRTAFIPLYGSFEKTVRGQPRNFAIFVPVDCQHKEKRYNCPLALMHTLLSTVQSMRHFVTLSDITTEELQQILELAMTIKREFKQGKASAPLAGKVLAMIFEKQSLRTRVSFEAGMFQLGGTAMSLGSEIGFGKREATKDIAQVLSSMVDVIMFRAMEHKSVEDLAKYSTCPVINGLTDQSHPCQALADIMTIYENFGRFEDINIAWVGDANNVATSLLHAAAKLGMKMSVASPERFCFDEEKINKIIEEEALDGFELDETRDPVSAVRDAHVVCTDVWVSMGQESEEEERKKVFAPYQVNGELLSKARSDAVFLHCLPARRGQEVTDEVMDSPQSRVVQQAENRLHAQKGLLVWLLR